MKPLLFITLLLVNLKLSAQESRPDSSYIDYKDLYSKVKIVGKLGQPLGTIMEIKCRIVDDKPSYRLHKGIYQLNILEINKKPVTEKIISEFEDETGNLPAYDFALYKFLYKKDTGILNSDMVEKMNKEYVGKEFTLFAYETGSYVGLPDNYYKYAPMRNGTSFYFKTFLIVISIKTD
jgi:hypothetical protein